jgi:hypothetical protein
VRRGRDSGQTNPRGMSAGHNPQHPAYSRRILEFTPMPYIVEIRMYRTISFALNSRTPTMIAPTTIPAISNPFIGGTSERLDSVSGSSVAQRADFYRVNAEPPDPQEGHEWACAVSSPLQRSSTSRARSTSCFLDCFSLADCGASRDRKSRAAIAACRN